MTEPVLLTVADGVARITFNRPDRLNAIDRAMADAFEAAAMTALADKTVKVVLLRGNGRAFMAGGDLGEFHQADDIPPVAASVIDPVHRTLSALAASPVLVLAAAQGPIAGAGMSITLGADLSIVGDTATFNMSYARIATTPDSGGTWALARLVGLRKAMEIVLLSETIDANEALTMGLVNRVVPAEELDQQAEALALRLARGPTLAFGQIKGLLRASLNHDLDNHLAAEKEAFLTCAGSADFREGLAAFFSKRKPVFSVE